MKSKSYIKTLQLTACGFCLAIGCFATGCQISVGGQLLPSAHYMTDDLQYFPPSAEFKLQNEANALENYKAEQALNQN